MMVQEAIQFRDAQTTQPATKSAAFYVKMMQLLLKHGPQQLKQQLELTRRAVKAQDIKLAKLKRLKREESILQGLIEIESRVSGKESEVQSEA